MKKGNHEFSTKYYFCVWNWYFKSETIIQLVNFWILLLCLLSCWRILSIVPHLWCLRNFRLWQTLKSLLVVLPLIVLAVWSRNKILKKVKNVDMYEPVYGHGDHHGMKGFQVDVTLFLKVLLWFLMMFLVVSQFVRVFPKYQPLFWISHLLEILIRFETYVPPRTAWATDILTSDLIWYPSLLNLSLSCTWNRT